MCKNKIFIIILFSLLFALLAIKSALGTQSDSEKSTSSDDVAKNIAEREARKRIRLEDESADAAGANSRNVPIGTINVGSSSNLQHKLGQSVSFNLNQNNRTLQNKFGRSASLNLARLQHHHRHPQPFLHPHTGNPESPRVPRPPPPVQAGSSSTPRAALPEQLLELHLPIEGNFELGMLRSIISQIYVLPAFFVKRTPPEARSRLMYQDHDPENSGDRKAQYQEKVRSHYAQKLVHGQYSYGHQNIIDYLPTVNVDQLIGYLADLRRWRAINQDFDINKFRQIPLEHINHVENVDGNNRFNIKAAIEKTFDGWPENYAAFMQNRLAVRVHEECGQRSMEGNAALLCVLGHYFAFAVELQRILEEQFVPFQQAVDKAIKRWKSNVPIEKKRGFNAFLSWIKQKVDATWMVDAAKTIFGQEPKVLNANQAIIDPINPPSRMFRSFSMYFTDVCRSYQELAVELICMARIV